MLVIASLALLKAKDVFTMAHIVMIGNLYVIPLLLIGIELERFSSLSFAKTIMLIILNFVVVSLLCHAIIKRAIADKIRPDALAKES